MMWSNHEIYNIYFIWNWQNPCPQSTLMGHSVKRLNVLNKIETSMFKIMHANLNLFIMYMHVLWLQFSRCNQTKTQKDSSHIKR
jgi:hypothetical protein